MSAKKKEQEVETKGGFIPTGSTLLNLALSDKVDGGYPFGKIINLIGDSSAGKSMLALTMLAELCRDSRFDNYELIYDDTEVALEFDIPKLFGIRVDKRIKRDVNSRTIQQWYGNHLKMIVDNIPFIYVTDSFDGLTSEEEQKRGDEIVKKVLKGETEDIKGSYKSEKAKWASEAFRNFAEGVEKINSLSLIISQTRDNLNVTYGSKKTKSGGRALEFWSSHEIWLSKEGSIKANSSKTHTIGQDIIAKIKKNKITGKLREIYFPIYYDYGVDDIASCINFLVDNKHWTKKGGGYIIATELNQELRVDDLISLIEETNQESVLKEVTGKVWNEIEESIKLNRKPKYDL